MEEWDISKFIAEGKESWGGGQVHDVVQTSVRAEDSASLSSASSKEVQFCRVHKFVVVNCLERTRAFLRSAQQRRCDEPRMSHKAIEEHKFVRNSRARRKSCAV